MVNKSRLDFYMMYEVTLRATLNTSFGENVFKIDSSPRRQWSWIKHVTSLCFRSTNLVLGSLVKWLATLPVAGELKQGDHYGPFQPRLFYDSVTLWKADAISWSQFIELSARHFYRVHENVKGGIPENTHKNVFSSDEARIRKKELQRVRNCLFGVWTCLCKLRLFCLLHSSVSR